MISLDYLNDERLKIWEKIIDLEELIRKKTPEYEKEARQASRKTSEFRNKSEESKNITEHNANLSTEKINQIENVLFEVVSLQQKASKAYSELKERLVIASSESETAILNSEKVAENVEKLKSIVDNEPVLSEKVIKLEKTYEQYEVYASKVELLYKNCTTKKKEIEDLHLEIIGYSGMNAETGEEEIIEGLKSSLENSYMDLKNSAKELTKNLATIEDVHDENYKIYLEETESEVAGLISKWEKEYQNKSCKIESLLPNALTAGLSHAYSKKKDDEIAECKGSSETFQKAIKGMIATSLIPFAVSIWLIVNHKAIEDVIMDIPRLVFSILPLYIPVLWVAYSSSKKINLSKRLIEEYSHKEALSKTFEGLSKQISNIEDNKMSRELKSKLLFNILEVSAENPGKLIYDYNKADHPLMDALDKSIKLTNAVNRLSIIPGFSKMATLVSKKSKEIIHEEGQKAVAGLDAIDSSGESCEKVAE